MKKVLFWFLVAGAMSLSFDAVAAPPVKVQITVVKKRGDVVRGKAESEGGIAKSTEGVSYAFSLKNLSFSDLGKLTVDYILLVERPKIGDKRNDPIHVERVKGSKAVEALTRQAPQTVTTDELILATENVTGGYIYRDGGRIKAEDTVVGVWVRVLQDGQIVGEYAAPATITKQGWDKN